MLGERSHRLVVVDAMTDRSGKRVRYLLLCLCDCGELFLTEKCSVRTGHTKSCGCLTRDRTIERNKTHGHSKDSEYRAWAHMLGRCRNKNKRDYKYYGGRGIKVCERWLNFENFLQDIGEKPTKDHTLDRIDVDGDYEPGNCRWATRSEQCRNQRSNRRLTFNGETLIVQDWAEKLGVPPDRIRGRLRKGWSTEDILTIKQNGRYKRKTAV